MGNVQQQASGQGHGVEGTGKHIPSWAQQEHGECLLCADPLSFRAIQGRERNEKNAHQIGEKAEGQLTQLAKRRTAT